jgi:hypothetical protein
MLAIQSDTNLAYCRVVMQRSRWRGLVNKKSPGFLPDVLEVVIDRLSGLFGYLESDRTGGYLLPHSCTINDQSMGCNIFDLEADYITAPEFAVDGEIEHRHITKSTTNLQHRPDRPDVLRP